MNVYRVGTGTSEDVREQTEEMTAGLLKNTSAVNVFTVCCLLVYFKLNK